MRLGFNVFRDRLMAMIFFFYKKVGDKDIVLCMLYHKSCRVSATMEHLF